MHGLVHTLHQRDTHLARFSARLCISSLCSLPLLFFLLAACLFLRSTNPSRSEHITKKAETWKIKW